MLDFYRSLSRAHLLCSAAAAAAFIYCLLFGQASNCGGTNQALSAVRDCGTTAVYLASQRPTPDFIWSQANAADLANLEAAVRVPAIRGRLRVSTKPISNPEVEPRRIIVVCDRAFTNVPRTLILPRVPMHAIGYSDGSVSLISAAEFARLDLSTFESLEVIFVRAGF